MSHSPLFNLMGSYFPGWMLCILVAIVLSVLLRLLVRKLHFEDHLEPAILTYPALTVFFSLTLWLAIFA